MKRGTTPILKVKIDKIDHDEVASIQFLFKQVESEHAREKVTKVYPGTDVSYDSENNLYLISFTEEETREFAEEVPFYMDTKIRLMSGMIPATTIERLLMRKTLFGGDYDSGQGC